MYYFCNALLPTLILTDVEVTIGFKYSCLPGGCERKLTRNLDNFGEWKPGDMRYSEMSGPEKCVCTKNRRLFITFIKQYCLNHRLELINKSRYDTLFLLMQGIPKLYYSSFKTLL